MNTKTKDLSEMKVTDKIEVEEISTKEPAILININKLYKDHMSEKEIYEATRESWRINIARVSNIKIVCSVYRGIIKEVFMVDKWLPSPDVEGRYIFEGKVAPENVRNQYINKSVTKYWKKGSRYPIKYINA